ncbi:MAG TPA: VOC family protein [Polyangiales bacterium]
MHAGAPWHAQRMEINGIAHVILTVRDIARSHDFYRPLLTKFGMRCVVDTPVYVYYVGGRTALGLRPGSDDQPFSTSRVGLHHLCFRARSREDVDAVHAALPTGTVVLRAPEPGPWAPGYYSVLFEDPDGIRLEVNFVPGKGLLDPDVQRPADAP